MLRKEGAGRALQVGSINPDEPSFQPFQCAAPGRECACGDRSVRDICLWCANGRGVGKFCLFCWWKKLFMSCLFCLVGFDRDTEYTKRQGGDGQAWQCYLW